MINNIKPINFYHHYTFNNEQEPAHFDWLLKSMLDRKNTSTENKLTSQLHEFNNKNKSLTRPIVPPDDILLRHPLLSRNNYIFNLKTTVHELQQENFELKKKIHKLTNKQKI